MREIVTQGAAILGEKTAEVPKALFGSIELKKMVREMSESLRATEHGVAIAANQIRLPYRIFVVRGFVLEGKERSMEDEDVAFINPKLTKLSRKKELLEEGCLSVPGFRGTIKRSVKATVTAHTVEGKKMQRGASGLLAQIFQHECDHLDGHLYVEKALEIFEDKDEKEEE